MENFDQTVLTELKKVTGGVTPEFYLFILKTIPLWLRILLGGGLLSAFLEKRYVMGYSKETFYFLRMGGLSGETFEVEGSFNIKRSDVTSAKFFGFGPAKYFTLNLLNGEKLRLVASTMISKLPGQKDSIEKMQKLLGV